MTITAAVPFSGEETAPSVASARCLLVATREHVHAVVVLRYALDPPDRELVLRGLLASGWGLVAAPQLVRPSTGGATPRLAFCVDELGAVDVTATSGERVFAGLPEEPVTTRWVQHAAQQDAVPVFLGVWGVDLGNDVDLVQCARSGKLVGTSGRYVPTAPM